MPESFVASEAPEDQSLLFLGDFVIRTEVTNGANPRYKHEPHGSGSLG